MMETGKKRFEQAFSQAMDGKEDSPELIPGVLGAYVAGVKSLRVVDRPDYVWVRLRNNPADAIQAYNDAVALHWDLPVLVCRDPVFTDRWKIWGRNISQYESWGGQPYVIAHGNQHTFGGGDYTGGDIVWTFKRQFMSLLPRPYASGTMNVWVEPDYYYWMGDYYWWPGSGSPDLTPYKPTGSQHAKFVTIYLDGDDGLLKALIGEEFNYVPPPSDPTPYMPIPEAADGIPICAVALMTGTSQIDWYNIYDLRIIPASPIPTGSYFIEQMIAEHSISGIAAWDDGVPMCTGTIIDFGANLDVTCSGTVIHVESSGGGGGAHRFRVGQPIPLNTATGTCWAVPDYTFATGSLAVSVNGIVQTPLIDYTEQYPGSGTFCFVTGVPPTGSFLTTWYGVEV